MSLSRLRRERRRRLAKAGSAFVSFLRRYKTAELVGLGSSRERSWVTWGNYLYNRPLTLPLAIDRSIINPTGAAIDMDNIRPSVRRQA